MVQHLNFDTQLDFDAVSRESKGHSKELYLWGQEQVEDVKDGEYLRRVAQDWFLKPDL